MKFVKCITNNNQSKVNLVLGSLYLNVLDNKFHVQDDNMTKFHKCIRCVDCWFLILSVKQHTWELYHQRDH